jgi:Lamin Tail Domain
MSQTRKLSASLLHARLGLVCAISLLAVLFGLGEFRVVALQITELLAENDGGLRDADGDTPDWIELFNDSASPLNLAGWHLTDQPTNLAKWTFPATNLPPGTFLIVFASGKDRAVAGAELHTNFKLDSGGGYLALVAPDGITISQAMNYPSQRANVSSGPPSTNAPTVNFLPVGASAR